VRVGAYGCRGRGGRGGGVLCEWFLRLLRCFAVGFEARVLLGTVVGVWRGIDFCGWVRVVDGDRVAFC